MNNTERNISLCSFGDCKNKAVATGKVFAIVFETATAEALKVYVCEEHRNVEGFFKDEE